MITIILREYPHFSFHFHYIGLFVCFLVFLSDSVSICLFSPFFIFIFLTFYFLFSLVFQIQFYFPGNCSFFYSFLTFSSRPLHSYFLSFLFLKTEYCFSVSFLSSSFSFQLFSFYLIYFLLFFFFFDCLLRSSLRHLVLLLLLLLLLFLLILIFHIILILLRCLPFLLFLFFLFLLLLFFFFIVSEHSISSYPSCLPWRHLLFLLLFFHFFLGLIISTLLLSCYVPFHFLPFRLITQQRPWFIFLRKRLLS